MCDGVHCDLEELDEPIALDLPPPSGYGDAPEPETVAEDLTRHPLAGSPVTMVLEAEDGAGQRGQSEAQNFVLPARIFTEPMAKALIEQRRALAWDIRDAWDVLDLLEAVTDYPDDYFKSPTAFLATSTAIKRLDYALREDRVGASRDEILDLLWEAAIRLEEGDLSNALEQLRAAQRRLKDALERGASDEELEQLMDELRQAMNDYLDELTRQAMREPQNGEQGQQQQQQGEAMTREDLERMLEQLEEMAKSGAREQAEQMLSMLGQMLENLRMSRGQGQGQGGEQEQALQDMMQRQQDLADETFRELQDGQQQNRAGQGQNGQPQQGQGQQGQGQQGQGQQGQGQQGQQGEGQQGQGQQGEGQQPGQGQGQGQPGQQGQGRSQQFGERGQGQGNGSGLRGEQRGLQGELGDLIPGLPGDSDAVEALREAERDMGAAGDDLGTGDLNSALDDQARALDRLREGAQALARENRQQQQQGQGRDGPGGNAEVGQNAERLDPFGRIGRTFGPDDGLGVDVPGERARNRALEIQREIRRREAERARPDTERDYLKRLQDRF